MFPLQQKKIAQKILPDLHFSFRIDRSTNDINFVCKQLRDKGLEHAQRMCIASVDLRKAFDLLDGRLLFSILERFACPPVILGLPRVLHTGNTAGVCVCPGISERFVVTMVSK